jgi:hypothetical protein
MIYLGNCLRDDAKEFNSSKWVIKKRHVKQGENSELLGQNRGVKKTGTTLDRGSSTTNICQAVPIRRYQIDQPSLSAVPVLSQGLTERET